MRVRTKKSKKTKYFLSKHEFLAVYHYALQYPEWHDEYTALVNKGAGSVGYTSEPHGNGISKPTERDGIRAAELKTRMTRIEEAAQEAAGDLYPWLMLAVTDENASFSWLRDKHRIPCGRNKYLAIRHHFYWILSKKGTLGDNFT